VLSETLVCFQARSILELAKKNFENLRQDSDDNAGSEFSADAGLATGGENTNWSNYDQRKGSHLTDKSALADSSGRLHGSRNNDVYTSWLVDNKFERNDEFTGLDLEHWLAFVH